LGFIPIGDDISIYIKRGEAVVAGVASVNWQALVMAGGDGVGIGDPKKLLGRGGAGIEKLGWAVANRT
jgi:hypothetical protein